MLRSIGWAVLGTWGWQLVKMWSIPFIVGLFVGWFIWA
jgi:hypothetical protein